MKLHPLQHHRTARGGQRRCDGMDRRDDGRLGVQELHESLGGARRAQQIAIHLAQDREGTGQNDHVKHGLAQRPCAQVAPDHRLRALVQAPEQSRRGGDDHKRHQGRARRRAPYRHLKSGAGGVVEAGALACLGGVALHHRHGVEHLSGNAAGIGHAVLAGTRELADAPAKPQRGRHHQDQYPQDLHHHHRAGVDQHDQRAQAHHGVAQAHAQGRADDGLHQRGVGGQS